MAGYDPQRNRSRKRASDVSDEPAPIDALLGPAPRVAPPEPTPVAVNDEVVAPAPEPVADLRAVPNPEPAADPEPVVEDEPRDDLDPEVVPREAPPPASATRPVGQVVAALAALAALIVFLVAWRRRTRG